MKLTVVGCSPAWPNPGGAQSGYLLEGPGRLLLDCGPGVLARLRESYSSNGWPEVDAIAITHFHLDHWGDLVPWVWGTMWGLGQDKKRPELWLPPGGREELAAFGTRFGTPDMFVRVFEPKEYVEGEPFTAAGLEVTAVRLPHYTVQTYGFASRIRRGRSPIQATRARARSSPTSPSTSISSCARRRSRTANRTASPGVISRPTRRSRPSRPQARRGSSSRTAPRSSGTSPASSRPKTA